MPYEPPIDVSAGPDTWQVDVYIQTLSDVSGETITLRFHNIWTPDYTESADGSNFPVNSAADAEQLLQIFVDNMATAQQQGGEDFKVSLSVLKLIVNNQTAALDPAEMTSP